MSKHPKIDRLEYMFFYDGLTALIACKEQITKRYKDAFLSIPADVKVIVWCCDICISLLQQHLKFCQNLRKENVHKSENYKK